MNDKLMGIVGFILCAVCIIGVYFVPKPKHIDWPEEIQIAEPGDTLIVEKVTNNNIQIGFKK